MTKITKDRIYLHDVPKNWKMPVLKKLRLLRRWRSGTLPRGLFILTSASKLPDVSEVVRESNDKHYLRALFVRNDVDGDMLPQMLDRARLRTLRNMLVHSDQLVPLRVLTAWNAGAQEELIAQATFTPDRRLVVLSCALKRFEVLSSDIPALKKLTGRQLSKFDIDEDGSYIHWPAGDIHLDLSAIRSITDPEWRMKKEVEQLAGFQTMGSAIREIRKEAGLRQEDVGGLSARQLRRIEHGGRPTSRSLKLLARAHQMGENEYMECVAKRSMELLSPE